MDNVLVKAVYVILLSLGLAFVFNILFFGKLIGISLVIFVGVFLAVVYFLGKREDLAWQSSWWLVVLIVFFAIMPAIRANEFLIFLNVCAVFGLLMLLVHQLVGTPVFLMKLKDYAALLVLTPFRMLFRGLQTVSLLGQIHSSVKNRDVLLRVLKGVVMAVPILIVFAILFSQADLAFSKFLGGFVEFNVSERTMQYLALLAFSFVAALCYLSYVNFSKRTDSSPVANVSTKEVSKSGRGIEVLVFLGLISALFFVFIIFQLTYLFGGEANIVNAGFTYAEYARRGFWELLAVSIISLGVLLAAEKYSLTDRVQDKFFQIPALILVLEVVVVIFAAFKRLSLYIDAYGMTMLRFYVAGFIILLFVLFALLAVKFILSKREEFYTFGALLSVAGFVAAVNFINPDAYIARTNIDQFKETGKLDVLYAGDLSPDAASEVVEMYGMVEGDNKTYLQELLKEQRIKVNEAGDNWQSSNLSRSRAARILNDLNL